MLAKNPGGLEGEIQQVLFNLLINAGQLLSSADEPAPRIEVHLRREGESVVITVEDNGPGMDEEMSRRVFEPFFTTKDDVGGTGLGLSIAYFIVCDHHRGSMSVESVPDRGSVFTVRLPLKQ